MVTLATYACMWKGNYSSINIAPSSVFEHQQEKFSLVIEVFGCQKCIRDQSWCSTMVSIRNVTMEIRISWITDLCQNVRVKLVKKSST